MTATASSTTTRAPSRRFFWTGAACAGAAAGLVLVALTLLLGLLTGVPSPPELMQDAISERLGGEATSWVIERLQFWSKPALLLGWAAAQVVAVALFSALAAWAVHRWKAIVSPRLLFLAGGAGGFVYWVGVGLLILPGLGLGAFGAGVRDGGPAIGLALPAHLAAGLTLALLWRWLAVVPVHTGDHSVSTDAATRVSPGAGEDDPASPDRRRLLAGAVAGGAATIAGVAVWRIVAGIGERATSPAAAQRNVPVAIVPPDLLAAGGALPFLPPPGISEEITPTEQFYVISKNLRDPVVRSDDWSLEVTGMVATPLRLSYAEVTALPAREQISTLMCISNAVGGDLISTARWTGVPLADVLDRAGIRDGADWLLFHSEDGYTESIPVEVARSQSSLLAYAMNGEPLTDKHGFPLRVVLTGRYGMKNPKWLKKIEVVPGQVDGYWEKRYWDREAIINTMSRFDTRPRAVPADATVLLGGVAFGGAPGVRAVEVSTDGGTTWQPAAVKPPRSPHTWSLWSFGWATGAGGKARLLVRATDGAGRVQDATETDPHPSGATGLHGLDTIVR